jgi:hypothetical protein
MFKSIISTVTDFANRIGIFKKSDVKAEPLAVKDEPTIKVDSPKIIEEQPIKVEHSHIGEAVEPIKEVDEPIQKAVEPIEEVKEPIKEVDEPIQKVVEPIEEVEHQTIVEGFEMDYEYDSDDEVVIHKQIYRTFTVKAPYNGPSQIVLSEKEDLVKVHQNGQYIAAHMNSIEDYGTDEEASQFKVIYNIIVEG